MDIEEPLRKCNECKVTKPKSLFYRYKYCKRCHIKNYIDNHLCNARIANHLNLSIDELNDIMKIHMNDPTRNLIGEHSRRYEIMSYFTGHNMRDSTIITNDVIDTFLDENVVPF
jgi:hypothetical protein